MHSRKATCARPKPPASSDGEGSVLLDASEGHLPSSDGEFSVVRQCFRFLDCETDFSRADLTTLLRGVQDNECALREPFFAALCGARRRVRAARTRSGLGNARRHSLRSPLRRSPKNQSDNSPPRSSLSGSATRVPGSDAARARAGTGRRWRTELAGVSTSSDGDHATDRAHQHRPEQRVL